MIKTRWLLLVGLWLSASLVSAQTGLQGFDPNYPDTPAGDEPRGFTPQIMPVARPAPPPPVPSAGTADKNAQPDPFTAPDPMMDGPASDGADDADDSADAGL